MRTKILLTIGAVIIVGGLFLLLKPEPPVLDNYRYELTYDSLSRESDEVSMIIYKKDLLTDTGEHYTSIGAEGVYLHFIEKFPDKEKEVGEISQFSMTTEYIEGLSSDNKFVSGKLIDPTTKQQIGYWTYDLDKKEFSEMTLNLSK